MSTAHSYGQPRIRVRRIGDVRGRIRSRRQYEVEFTPVGSDVPDWVETMDDRATGSFLVGHLGAADTQSVTSAADAAWDGTTGRWESLYPGDRDLGPAS